VDPILRLSRKVGPNPTYEDVRAIRWREILAPGGTNRNVHPANVPQAYVQTVQAILQRSKLLHDGFNNLVLIIFNATIIIDKVRPSMEITGHASARLRVGWIANSGARSGFQVEGQIMRPGVLDHALER
jgi:hypothetical protein